MYAVILTGGKQYRVKPGDSIKVEKIDAPVGSKIKIPNLLLIYDEQDVKVNPDQLQKANVQGTIKAHGRHKKVINYKKKRRKGYTRKIGHRQDYTEVLIENINLA